jgi:hypothetical protein
MASAYSSVKLDKRRLQKIRKESPARADAIIGKIAFDLQADIQLNMNTVSPSPPYEPPGIVTGTLKNSVLARKIRQFLWRVFVGVTYGLPLEFGTKIMAPRPFFRPAVYRMVGRIPAYFKALVEEE